MAAANRANRLTKLVSDLKKRYKPAPPTTRPLFETLVFATLLENSLPDAAAKALAELQSGYYDWNEVRVSTRAELAERAKSLNDPLDTADRLKRTLQSVFETIYGFDLEALKKQNLGVAVKQISGFDGVTPFAVNYVTQHALAGHAIAVNGGVMIALLAMDIVTEAEAKKGVVPGLERAIPKNKGVEAQAVLHELGVEVAKNPYGPTARKLLTDIDPSCKDRLPKRPKVEEPAPPAEKASLPTPAKGPVPVSKEAAAASKDGAAKKPVPGKDAPSPAGKKPAEAAKPAPAPANKNSAPASKPPASPNKAAEAKKPEPKAPAAKAQPAKVKKPDAKKPEASKKPEAKKAEVKKPEAKKPETKKPAAAPPKKPAPAKAAPPKKPAPASKPSASAAMKDAKKAPVPPAGKKGAAKKAADKKPAKRKPK